MEILVWFNSKCTTKAVRLKDCTKMSKETKIEKKTFKKFGVKVHKEARFRLPSYIPVAFFFKTVACRLYFSEEI